MQYPPDNGQPSIPPQPSPFEQPHPPVYQPQPQPVYQQPPINVNVNLPYPQPLPQQTVIVNIQQRPAPGGCARALYFVFVGWWLGYLWLCLGFGLCALIITIPIGLAMLNRLPQVMTLKQPSQTTQTQVVTSAGVTQINIQQGGPQQYSFLVRAVYYILVGWWAGLLWANIAYFLCLLIVTLPVGIVMFDKLPMVLTLRRN